MGRPAGSNATGSMHLLARSLPADVEREAQVVGHDGCHSVQCFIGSNGTLNSPDLNRAGCSMTALPACLN